MTEETGRRDKQTLRAAASGIIERALAAVRAATQRSDGRRQAEQALRASEERYRDLVGNINDAIFEIDTSGRITYVSPAIEASTGYSPSEMIGWSFVEFFLRDDLPATIDKVQKRLSGNREPSEYRLLTKSGEARWIRSLGRPILQGDRVVAFRGVLTDISERKRAEEALRKSEEKYRNLVDFSNDIVCRADESGNWLFLSPAVKRILGYEPAELVGRSAFDFIFPEDIASTQEAHESVVREGRRFWEYETRCIRKDGSVVTVAWNVVAFRDAQGNIIGTQGVGRDITERKRAEEALRESAERYRNLVENINEAIYEADASGRITYVSPVIEEISGYSTSEVTGRSFAEFIHPDDLPTVQESFQQRLVGNEVATEYRVLLKSGEVRWIRTFSRPIYEGERVVGLRGVLTDITERKQMEEALQKAREELEAKAERQILRRNPYGLTFRELTVLQLVAAGESDKRIGTTLGISPLTAQKHISNILAKMRAASRTEAGVRAVRERLLD